MIELKVITDLFVGIAVIVNTIFWLTTYQLGKMRHKSFSIDIDRLKFKASHRDDYLDLLHSKIQVIEMNIDLLLKKTSPTNEIDKYEDALPFHSKDKCESGYNFCCCRWCKDMCQCMQWYRDKQATRDKIEQEIKLTELEEDSND
jgi:hypothetical protein